MLVNTHDIHGFIELEFNFLNIKFKMNFKTSDEIVLFEIRMKRLKQKPKTEVIELKGAMLKFVTHRFR